MSYNFFAYLSRMRYISRWSLMRNALDENIQEHSHQVAVLAHALGVIRRDVFGVDCDPEEYAAVALYHDSSEILTGDLPTPIKYHSAEIREAYRQVEELACEKLLATLPEPLRASFGEVMTGERPRAAAIWSRRRTSFRHTSSASRSARPATTSSSPPRSRPARSWKRALCRRCATSSTISSPLSS